MPEDWKDERSRTVAAQAAAAERAAAKESAQAQALIDDFVSEARRLGVEPEPLSAPGKGNRGLYRTGLIGWYLTRNRNTAVDSEGRYYVLRTAGGLRERLRGTTVASSDPPLIVNRGGRDGEAVDLEYLLRRRLDEG